MELVTAGDADGLWKVAREANLYPPSAGNDGAGQLKGVDLILENEEVTSVLNYTHIGKKIEKGFICLIASFVQETSILPIYNDLE